MNDNPKWYHKAIVISMFLTILPTVLFQFHFLERIAIQELKNEQQDLKYKRMKEVADKMEERFFPKVTVEDVIREGKKLKNLIERDKYNKHYRKKYGKKFKFERKKANVGG